MCSTGREDVVKREREAEREERERKRERRKERCVWERIFCNESLLLYFNNFFKLNFNFRFALISSL